MLRTARLDVSLDLIFGVPGETLDVWRDDLLSALQLEPDHVSTYGLTFEHGADFWRRLVHGELTRIDEELERALYAEAIDTLVRHGFEHYEVSNFAQPGKRCRHNEAYWAGDEYFAAGPGKPLCARRARDQPSQHDDLHQAHVSLGNPPSPSASNSAPEDRARELLVFGLRRLDGVDRSWFAARSGFDLDALVGEPLRRHVALGLLSDDGRRIRLTHEGLFVSDAIWPHFLRA